jgi:hypothetical protein
MRYVSVAFLIIFCSVLNAAVIEHSYHFQSPQARQAKGYDTIHFAQTMLTGVTGEPTLPYRAVSLLLPPGEEAVSIEILPANLQQLDGEYTLYPAQASQPIGVASSQPLAFNHQVYKRSYYPTALHGQLTTQFMHGYGFGFSSITPVVYNPASRSISWYSDVTVRITTAPSTRATNALAFLRDDAAARTRAEELCENSSMLQRYSAPESRDGEYDALIVCPAIFLDSFNTLAEHYALQGLAVQVITLNDCIAGQAGQDNAEKLRNYIIQEYQNNGISHVVLGGDVEHIPYRGFYCTVQSSSLYEDDDIPSDLYYSGLDGNWNTDGDGYWGEIGEDDLLPEVAVGRISASNMAELDNILNKVYLYENAPVLGELRDPLLVGENMYNDPLTWGGDYLDLLVGYHEDNGYTTDGIPADHDITYFYDRDMGQWSGYQLISEINNGHSFIYHAGHSSSNYNMRLNSTDITNTNFGTVNGVDHLNPLVYSHGCISGSFDNNDCIGEKMVYLQSFASVYIGNSRYGWFNEGQTEGPSAHLNREFCDALYTNKTNRVGATHMESRIDTAPWVTAPGQWEDGALRWCFYDCNVLGDPLLPIWTDEPIAITVTNDPTIGITVTEYELTVTSAGSGVQGLNCTLLYDGEIFGVAQTDDLGNATINLSQPFSQPGMAQLTVSGYNCLVANYDVEVIPDDYYVAITEYFVASGDDDVLEFGEDATLGVTLQNLSQGDVHNLSLTFSSDDTFITITDAEEQLGTISQNQILTVNDVFALSVASDVPDNHTIATSITVDFDEGSYVVQHNFVAYNANPAVTQQTIVDNENGRLDAGESAQMLITLANSGGADVANLDATLSSTDDDITIVQSNATAASLDAGMQTDFSFIIEAGQDIPWNYETELELSVIADNGFSYLAVIPLCVNSIVEDFESADFTAFAWQMNGAAEWSISDEGYQGEHSAQSGDVADLQFSDLILTVDVYEDGTLSFWRRVSSEEDYDKLRFYIDSQIVDEWSGELDWQMESFDVSEGQHTFKWRYFKDSGLSVGDDCAWIDDIRFPRIYANSVVGPSVTAIAQLGHNYPNPFNPQTSFSLSTPADASSARVVIYNARGQVVRHLEATPGSRQTLTWNGVDNSANPVGSGIYFYSLQIDGLSVATRKCLLLK